MTKNALGRGFDSLIPVDFTVDDVTLPGEQVKSIAIEKLVANPDQPRKEFDEQTLKELAQSITRHGIIQPIVVMPHKDKFRIVAGERRFRAAQIAKLKTLPALVRNHKELEEIEIALVENVQRVDLSPLEQALSVAKLRDQFSLSLKEIAAKLGKAETTVSNSIRLLKLPKEAIEALQKNQISEGHARAILALSTDEKAQKELLNTIIAQNLSVREAEAFVHKKKDAAGSKKPKENSAYVSGLLQKLDKAAAAKINIREKKKGGVISISYSTNDELEKLLNKL